MHRDTDQSRPGRASDLIKRFQAQVDASGEQPLAVSSSFASPGRPRLSAGLVSKPRESLGAHAVSPHSRPSLPKDASPPRPPVPGVVATNVTDDGVTAFRSAGLTEKPVVPIEQQGRKNADEAFPDMRKGPEVTLAKSQGVRADAEAEADDAPSEAQPEDQASSGVRAASPNPPHPVVAQATLDAPETKAVPVSTNSITGHGVAADMPAHLDSLPPRIPSPSPSSPTASVKEGSLLRPMSPAADDSALRVPPTADGASPPPSPSRAASPSASLDARPPESARSPTASPSTSSSPPLSRSQSRRPSRSPTQTRQPTVPLPTSGRGLTTPTASSLAKARPRVSSTTSGARSCSRQGPQSPTAQRSTVMPSAPAMTEMLPRSARMSPTSSRDGPRAAASPGMARSRSAGTRAGTGTPPMAPAVADSPSPSPASASAASALRLRGGAPGPAAPSGVKIARRGRIGLAGAGARRPAVPAAPPEPVEKQEAEEGGKAGEEGEVGGEGGEGGEAGGEEEAHELHGDGIPVFRGFGAARPHGRIPIPMQEGGGAEGETKRAVMADEVERAGAQMREAEGDKEEGGEGGEPEAQ
ncbi:hypothetical protein JCM3770_004299 [Rhodotorula araucariae]